MEVRKLQTLYIMSFFLAFCNVLHICNVWPIPTYRVYQLYDMVAILLMHTLCKHVTASMMLSTMITTVKPTHTAAMATNPAFSVNTPPMGKK